MKLFLLWIVVTILVTWIFFYLSDKFGGQSCVSQDNKSKASNSSIDGVVLGAMIAGSNNDQSDDCDCD